MSRSSTDHNMAPITNGGDVKNHPSVDKATLKRLLRAKFISVPIMAPLYTLRKLAKKAAEDVAAGRDGEKSPPKKTDAPEKTGVSNERKPFNL